LTPGQKIQADSPVFAAQPQKCAQKQKIMMLTWLDQDLRFGPAGKGRGDCFEPGPFTPQQSYFALGTVEGKGKTAAKFGVGFAVLGGGGDPYLEPPVL
jgi:hypothetical protein